MAWLEPGCREQQKLIGAWLADLIHQYLLYLLLIERLDSMDS